MVRCLHTVVQRIMVVNLLLKVTVLSSLVGLGICSTNKDNGPFVYAPNQAVMNEDFLIICKTNKDVNGVRWKKDGQNLGLVYLSKCSVGNESKYSYSCKKGQFNLTIPKSQMTKELHRSVWTCVNLYGGSSKEFNLYINIPVTKVALTIKGEILKLNEGEFVELECVTGPCRPPANVSFQYEYEHVTTGLMKQWQERDEDTDTYNTTSRWTFQASRSQNGRNLTCKAVNGWNSGYFAQSIKIEIMYGPDIVRHSIPSGNLSVPEHDSVDGVTCFSDCNPACTFSWLKDDSLVNDGNTLYLTNVSRVQAGIYVCNASNTFGSRLTELKLEVIYPPTITKLEAKSNPLMENNSLEVLCKVDSFPPSNVTWMQGNSTLSSAVMSTYHHIKHAKCLDTGIYTCTASNGLGEMVSKAIDIFVNCKPRLDSRVMQQERQTKYLAVGSYLRVKVHFIAYPTPEVSWFFHRDASNLDSPSLISKQKTEVIEENNLFMHVYRLFIPSISDRDFGYYTIYVENQYGRSSVQIVVSKATRNFELRLSKKYLIIGISGAVGLFLLALVVVCFVYRKMSRREENLLEQAQEFEMQQQESVYQNKGRILELIAVESYEDLAEDNPIYNESKYGKMKEIKDKDVTDEEESSYDSVQKVMVEESNDTLDTTDDDEDLEDGEDNEASNADTTEYCDLIDVVKDDSDEDKRQSVSSDDYEDTDVDIRRDNKEINQPTK